MFATTASCSGVRPDPVAAFTSAPASTSVPMSPVQRGPPPVPNHVWVTPRPQKRGDQGGIVRPLRQREGESPPDRLGR